MINGDATIFKIKGAQHYFAYSGLDVRMAGDNVEKMINEKIDHFVATNYGASV